MAYLSSEDTKKIRTALKTNFKQFKFSVTNSHHTGVNISILSGPKDFGASSYDGYLQLNEYHPLNHTDGKLFQKMIRTVDKVVANHDNSEPQYDYFDVGYYTHWSAGKWNRRFVKTAK